MRICFFTPAFLPNVGGAELAVDAIARGIHARGHHIVVLAHGQDAPLDVPYPVERYAKPPFPRLYPERVGKRLAEVHEQHRFDLFLTKYAHPTGYAAIRLGKRLGVPTIVVSQGGDLYYSSKDRKRPHIWRRTVYTYRHADGLILISPYIEQLIREINPNPPMIARIPNGVEVAAMNEPGTKPTDFPTDRPFMLCLGNLGPMKGFDDALKAFAKVRSQLGGLRLAIVGNGPLNDSLRNLAKELKLGEDAIFAGQRVGGEKRWFIQNCAFGVMPSLEEGHALVSTEIISCGKPLIASLNSSFDGTVIEGENGLRVPAQNPDALADAFVRMQRADREAMGNASRRIAAQFDWPVVVDGYISFCEKVLAAKRSATSPAHPQR